MTGLMFTGSSGTARENIGIFCQESIQYTGRPNIHQFEGKYTWKPNCPHPGVKTAGLWALTVT